MEAQAPSLTFRYLSRFRCIGGACEDTCCGHWRVELDDATRDRLAALEGDSALREALGALDEMTTPQQAAPRRFLPQVNRDRGHTGDRSRDCVFLDQERL